MKVQARAGSSFSSHRWPLRIYTGDDFQTRLADMLRAHAERNGQTVGIYDGDLTKIKLADSPTTNA